MGRAFSEKEMYGEVKTRCPKCNEVVEVELIRTSARTRCSCGYMTASLRGI